MNEISIKIWALFSAYEFEKRRKALAIRGTHNKTIFILYV
jgi:hypothetical protein